MLKPGDPAPEFALKDADGKTWRLSEMKGQKIVLYFYPADDTPGCTRESCDFRDARTDFDNAGYTILGVSPQGADSKAKFIDKYSLNFPLLIDDDLAATRAYSAYKELGEYEGIPLHVKRSTFVIDEDGMIVDALYGVTAKGHVESLKEQIGV
ncbi:MAG: thioredoxin-dependent peroxiredoxin [Actinomycetota bacterium]|nr:thioredoxin-dependent peroxiredoxin [Actinomycetota bacterium]